jgi:hypothetical protein
VAFGLEIYSGILGVAVAVAVAGSGFGFGFAHSRWLL